MAEQISLDAKVIAKTRELRFSFAGVVESIFVEAGKIVGAGTVIARLKTNELEKKHQLRLEAYNKIRATFEQVKKKLEGNDDPDKKYLMDRAQADLNSGVLEVELSQLELESAELKCPFSGLVIDDGGIAPGMAISPASFPILIADLSTLRVLAEIDQEKIGLIKPDQYVEFIPRAFNDSVYKGRVLGLTPTTLNRQSDNFGVWIVLERMDNLLPGMIGKLTVLADK